MRTTNVGLLEWQILVARELGVTQERLALHADDLLNFPGMRLTLVTSKVDGDRSASHELFVASRHLPRQLTFQSGDDGVLNG